MANELGSPVEIGLDYCVLSLVRGDNTTVVISLGSDMDTNRNILFGLLLSFRRLGVLCSRCNQMG